MVETIANYYQEQELFTELVAGNFGPKILFLHGALGAGKSTFIKHCLNQFPDKPFVELDLQHDPLPMAMLFIRLGEHYTFQKLPFFTRTVAHLLEKETEADNPIFQVRMRQHLKDIGSINHKETLFDQFGILSDSLFYDASTFEKPTLLIINKFEKSSLDFQEWLYQHFLVRVHESQKMQVLVSGQEPPDIKPEYQWKGRTRVQELGGVHDPQIWLDWTEKAGYQPPSLAEMTEWVQTNQGSPSLIVATIKSECNRISSVMRFKFSPVELTEKIEAFFSLDEVKDICYKLFIRYENFPGHGTLKGLIRDLVEHVRENRRLPELISLCRKLRPAVF